MNNIATFHGRLGVQQRVVPHYRKEFFELLARSCSGGMSVFAGDVPQRESIPTGKELQTAQFTKSRNYHFRNIRSPFYLLWQSGFVNWLESWQPEILIVEANARYLSTFQGIRWMHSRGKPVIGWGLGAPEIGGSGSGGWSISGIIRKYLRKRLFGQLDGLVAYSHKGASEYAEVTGHEIPVFVASNAVARRPVGPAPDRKSSFEGPPIVLFVGRLQARKQLDNLIRACSKLPDGIQPVIWIVGDGPERGYLENLSKDIYSKTEFKGRKTGTELMEFFKRADLFVLPGTGGLAVQEAMTYALPVIVAEGDGTQGDLVHPENGWLIPSDNEQALIESLSSALSDPVRLRRMGEESYKIVQEEINVETMAASFVNALNIVSKTGNN